MRHFFLIFNFVLLCILLSSCQHESTQSILVFTKTKGYYHESIPTGVEAIQKLGRENGFEVDTTKDASIFTEENLKKYKAVVFFNTTGNVLNYEQQLAFERYIQAGGGYVGIHAAADTEYDWAWYNKLAGAYFKSHPNDPNVRKGIINIIDTSHQSTRKLPLKWERTDEWYNYKNIQPDLNYVATLDENSYEGGENGDFHPIAWYHSFDGGRAFYTGGGHTTESYSEPLFLQHVLGGIQYAMGDHVKLDFSKSYAIKSPEENRFVKTILSNDLNEPMELTVAPNGNVYFIERSGNFYEYDATTKATTFKRKFPVSKDSKESFGNGLLGITIDPNFNNNRFIYFFYTPAKHPLRQNISRFILENDGSLDTTSEKIIIEIPIDGEIGAHTGGSLAWDKNKNLFISTGDNTVPFSSDGFAPLDEIPGRITFDAQRSAGNTNDLRGKILRIHVNEDGTYSIPDGNLFPKGMAGTKPEIYTMGCRNPYRISVDQANDILYWGEIGPDAGKDGPQGPRGYDEINQAKKPGNYGWPYFVGNNKPYHHYDFAAKKVGELFHSSSVENLSINNTGLKKLPNPHKAMIWYPYDKSDEFTELDIGGRSIMAGPVYHFDDALKADKKLPAYFDKALFIYDWMRNWVFAVRLDENQNYKRLEQFMPVSGDFRRPVDMELGPDGTIYMLEYGSVYGIDNVDARLVRIEYNEGNRAPHAAIIANDTVGITPLKVSFKSKSYDFDEADKLVYKWQINGKEFNTEDVEYTFPKSGVYNAVLTVTDPSGSYDQDSIKIIAGNTLPEISISTNENTNMFFSNTPLHYNVQIKDKEDVQIDTKSINVSLSYVPKFNAATMGHQQISSFTTGKVLMANSDCKACHQLNAKSVGPAFVKVADKYKNDKGAIDRLAAKVIEGGSGVWGEHAMNAHPQLSLDDATYIVKYVLSLVGTKSTTPSLPQHGTVNFTQHKASDTQGRYFITATYTDKGGEAIPLSNSAQLSLRSALIQAEEADVFSNISRSESELMEIHNKSYFIIKNIDLKNIKSVTYRYSSEKNDALLEVHVGAVKGPVISSADIKPTGAWNKYSEINVPIKDPAKIEDLYFVFKKEGGRDLCNLDWIEFKK